MRPVRRLIAWKIAENCLRLIQILLMIAPFALEVALSVAPAYVFREL